MFVARTLRTQAARAPMLFRTKVTLPDLDYDYGALEPFISGQINELHHKKHHQTYVNGYNTAIEQHAEATAAGDVLKSIELQKAINFHGGGYRNHCLFWKNLAPTSQGGGELPTGALGEAIANEYGNVDNLIAITNAKLAGIQGSGWAWIVKNNENGAIEVLQTYNQDTVDSRYTPLVAIDAWEHAYYLQYQNVKADYFKAIWNVVNWKEAERRFTA
ncbi:CYFA0S30e00606g1_1 [Cyberlindnera fabianii]|uniref:Superoxide dismutase n=1 Tax=Cyberlindnera fabianii TaxID=36022 RepID=A0A061BBA7_CYBFA|nr:Superoxide dismutase [Mn], mitochondrial [Cyberlindnera fabianii]CDR47226.1 CYFA0S30e00606g1_1 [Cyberlindnera fabianii]